MCVLRNQSNAMHRNWITAAMVLATAMPVPTVMAVQETLVQETLRETIEEIRVVGARSPRPAREVLGTVDLIGRDELLRQVTVRTEDLVRYLPGVSVARADNRFGATEFTIRGLSGNRVTTLVDGIPVADQFDVGALSNAGQDYLIPDAISRVEILHGPASTLFGSDALGGVIAVLNRAPEEYLDPGRRTGGSTTLAWSGADRGRELNGAVAGRAGPTSAVLHVSLRESEELDAAGTDDEDPLDRRRLAARMELAHALESGDQLRLSLETFDETVESRAGRILGTGRQFVHTTALTGDDLRRRHAIRGEHDFGVEGAWAESGRLLLYGQRSSVEQVTDERRDRLDPPVAIQRQFDYTFEDLGAVLDLQSRFARGPFDHRIGWGLSLRRSEVRELRDGHLTELPAGTRTSTLLGENLPVRDFPETRIRELGVYVHDEIRFGDFTLIPALRLEVHDLDASADPLFREDHPDLAVEDVRETALAPKLGVQWRIAHSLDLFAQYARGFRAPPFEDVNIGLDIPRFNVRAIPNPDLEAETSDGIELGLRHRGERIRAELVLFGADYEDFIESRTFIGPDPATGVLRFQSRNLDRARVFGADLGLTVDLRSDLVLDVSANWTRGEDRDTDQPLNTIDPPSLISRLDWRPSRRWSAGAAVTAVAAKDRVDTSAGARFEPDGHVLLDLSLRYQPNANVQMNLGLFNLGNETYWHWASVRGRPEGDPLIDVLAAPGRHGAVSLRIHL